MKKKIYKNKRISRFTAACLSAMLAVTTLSGSTPDLSNVRAEITESDHIGFTITPGLSSNGATAAFSDLGSGVYGFAADGGVVSTLLCDYDSAGNARLNLSISDASSESMGFQLLGGEELCEAKVRFYVLAFSSTDSIPEYMTASEIDEHKIASGENVVPGDSVICIYARPGQTHEFAGKLHSALQAAGIIGDEEGELTADDIYDSYNDMVQYSLRQKYMLADIDDVSSSRGWNIGGTINQTHDFENAPYAQDASLSWYIGDSYTMPSNIKYAVVKYEEGMTAEDAVNNASWTSSGNVSFEDEGKYIGYVALYSDEDNLLNYEWSVVAIDKKPPTLRAALTVVNTEGENILVNTLEDGGVAYSNESVTGGDRLTVKARWKDTGSGIDKIQYKVNDGELQDLDLESPYIDVAKSGTTDVYMIATDKVGRSTEVAYTIIADIEPPTITGITLTDNYNHAEATGEYSLAATVTEQGDSGIDVSKTVVSIKNSDGDVVDEYSADDISLTDNGDGTYALALGIANTQLDGTYNIDITVYDNADNSCTDIYEDADIDMRVPDYGEFTFYYRKAGSSDEWSELGNRMINPYGYMEYQVTVGEGETDDIDNVHVNNVCATEDCSEGNIGTGISGRTGDVWVYDQLSIAPTEHKKRTLQFIFSDAINNKSTRKVSYNLAEEALEVKGYQILDPDDNVVTKIPRYTNQKYRVQGAVSSGHPIKEIKIQRKEEGADTVYSSLNGNQCVYNIETGRYDLDFDFPIPKHTNVNDYLESTKLIITDQGNHTETITIGTILYDMTKPQLTNVKYTLNGNSGTPDLSKWYRSASVDFNIVAGVNYENENMEAVLQSVLCTLSGAVSNNGYVINEEGLDSPVYNGKVKLGESSNIDGTVASFNATDKAGNAMTKDNVITLKVDATAPKIDNVAIENASDLGIYPTVPKIDFEVSDNLTLDVVSAEVEYPNGKTSNVVIDSASIEKESILKELEFNPLSSNIQVMDGTYHIVLCAKDMAGNVFKKTVTLAVDKTNPVVTAKIISGTMGGKQPSQNFDGTERDYYYRSNVGLELTCDDNNIDLANIVVTDNGTEVSVPWEKNEETGKYVAGLIVSQSGPHAIAINAKDNANNSAVEQIISFVIDVEAPVLTTTIADSYIYTASTGVVYASSDMIINVGVQDANKDAEDMYCRVVMKRPGGQETDSGFQKTSNSSFVYSDEADYTVSFYAVDMAGNISATHDVAFRVDKTFPEVSISGIGEDGTSNSAISVGLNLKEAFYWDAEASANIYRKAGDGEREALVKTINISPTGETTNISEYCGETGVYRIEMTASDRVGHKADTSRTFTVDVNAPQIKLSGVSNYDKTSNDVEIYSEIRDEFYLGKKVNITGTRADIDGNVHILDFGGINFATNPTIINKLFNEDGIYDIEITAIDLAGNTSNSRVHFTIDKTKPLISDLPIKDGSIVNEIDLDFDLDELVKDLTICEVHMYLNGSEYDGNKELADGAYKLVISATDELGHAVEKTVSFILDTKAPVFVVDGVSDGEIKDDVFNIKISLQDLDDILSSVVLDGNAVEVKNNTVELAVRDEGKHELKMSAKDKAGNTAEQTISFKYGEKTIVDVVQEHAKSPLKLIVAIISILLILMIIILVARRKNKR